MLKAAPVLSKPKPKPKAKPRRRLSSAPVQAAPPRPAARGICTTCVHAEACTFARDPSIRIAECGEFEGLRGESGGPVRHRDPAPAPAVRNPAAGLCATCEAFATCTLPRSEAGVWRCEEFR